MRIPSRANLVAPAATCRISLAPASQQAARTTLEDALSRVAREEHEDGRADGERRDDAFLERRRADAEEQTLVLKG